MPESRVFISHSASDRTAAQLIDALDGTHVWAERYDRSIGDVFAVQDEISDAVARAIVPAISLVERERIARKPPESRVPALGKLGRTAEAAAALRAYASRMPHLFAFYAMVCPPWFRPQDYDLMLDGLRKAGWQG